MQRINELVYAYVGLTVIYYRWSLNRH